MAPDVRLVYGATIAFAASLTACGAAKPPPSAPVPQAVPTMSLSGRELPIELTRRRSPQIARACARSALPGGRPAICPSLVPDVEPVRDAMLSGPIARANTLGYSLMSFNNGLVDRHFILGSGSERWLDRELFDTSLNEGSKRRPRRLPDRKVDGVTVRLYAFYGGPNSGHVGAVVKRADGLEAFASMHGSRSTDATILLALDLARRPRP